MPPALKPPKMRRLLKPEQILDQEGVASDLSVMYGNGRHTGTAR